MLIIKGNIAVLENDSHISKWVIESGRLDHDQNMLPLLEPYLKGTVIDIGAYIGDHSVYYSKFADKVICFEPNKKAFECLQHNSKSNMILFDIALSDKPEPIQMVLPNKNYGMAYATNDISNDLLSTMQMTRTLDSFGFKPDFIKIDAEGFELKILKGATKTITHRPVMLIEINKPALARNGTSFDEIYAYLRTFGYICRNIYPEQGFSDQQFDILCE